MAAAEQKKSYRVVKQFKGLNTKANRTAIDEGEFSWLENAMPIGYANLKTLNNYKSLGVTFSHTAVNFFQCNIGLIDYLVVFENDGSAEYVNLLTKAKGTIAPAGTFTSTGGIRMSQWKNKYALIADPNKGYFTWDGTNLVFVGAVGQVGVLSGGSGYTSAPFVTISAPNQTNGVQALATCFITNNAVSSITLTEAGSGYTSTPTVTISGGGGSGANAVAGLISFSKGTTAVTVTNGGSGYTNSANLVVTISGDGTGANAVGIVSGGQITQVIMTDPGQNYTAGNVSISGGGGNGATAILVPTTEPIVGIQSFSGRVWIAQGRTVTYSASGSVSDFTSVSADSVTLTDATLHGNIVQLISANNFLYIFGDDSINVFSDVRVTTSGATLFTNTNISASVGTKLPYAIFPYFRSVLFMNNYGVYALVGSTTSKISDALDGIFPYVDFNYDITGGQVLLNNILCAAFNFKYTGGQGTSDQDRYIQAVFFDKKWFLTSQGNSLKWVWSAPVGGTLNLYGTSATDCVQLYADKLGPIDSYVQTALDPMGDPIRTKQALKVGVEATLPAGTTLSLTVDSEVSSSPIVTFGQVIPWVNNSNNEIPWINNSLQVIEWSGGTGGYQLYKTDAKQYGKYLGMTVTATGPNFAFNGFEYEHELRVRF